VLCLTALLSGAARGLAMIALQRHVGRLAHIVNELKQVFSWIAIGPSISNFLGPLAAGLLIDASGFRAAINNSAARTATLASTARTSMRSLRPVQSRAARCSGVIPRRTSYQLIAAMTKAPVSTMSSWLARAFLQYLSLDEIR
jgi:hypothetical protein